MDTSTLAILLVNYGSHELLRRNLVPIAAHTPDALIVVVDSFSTERERGAVIDLANRQAWHLLTPSTNVGFGGGMNLAAARARELGATSYLLLNPDATIDQASLAQLRADIDANDWQIVAPVIHRPDGSMWSAGSDLYLATGEHRSRRRRQPGAQVVPWLSGAALMTSARLWQALGGFDERYFLYWEDVDLSVRASALGAALTIDERAIAVHDEGGTHDAQTKHASGKSSTYYYYNVRNRLLFAGTHLSDEQRRGWLRSAVPAAYRVLLEGGRRQLVTSPAPAKAALRGLRDGYVELRRSVAAAPAPVRPLVSASAPTEGVADADGRVAAHVTGDARPIRVLSSFPAPRPTTNPYIVMLGQALDDEPGVEHYRFSWRTALTGSYDVFHAHWPEILVNGHSPLKKLARQLLFVAFMARMRLHGTAIVRTVHNLELPSGISGREVALLRWFERRTTALIRINTSTQVPPGRPTATIIHGHYRDWFAAYDRPESVPGRFAYVGLIRRYKGVPALLQAFRETAPTHPDWSLTIGGRPSSAELAQEVEAAAGDDPRIGLHLEFLSDAELVSAVGESEIVVLPYQEMHNSGGALAALSLDRPVLLPDNEVNRALRDEVGLEWVRLYSGALSGDALVTALTELRPSVGSRPDLSAREWDCAAAAHVAAYRMALNAKGVRVSYDWGRSKERP